MAAQDFQIEIVPFPDDDSASEARTDDPGEEPVVADDLGAEEPEGEDPPVEESDEEDTAAADPVGGRAAQAAPPGSTTAVEEVVAVDRDDAALRSTTISGRLLFLTLGAVVLGAIIVLISVWGVTRVSGAGRDLGRIGAAETANARALTELRLAASTEVGDAALRSIDALTSTADELARPWVPDRVAAAARAADDAYLDAVAGGAADAGEASERAVAARTRVGDGLDDARLEAVDRGESARTLAIALALAVFVVGSVALVLVGRVIGRSVISPLRQFGRTLRRFGDGDLASRATVAGDEVGTLARSFNSMAESLSARLQRLSAIAERDAQLRMVNDALDLADREGDVYRILEQALAVLTPDNPGELLVNEPTSSRLWQVSTNPVAGPGGCPVETADGCPAMRRAQALTFDSPSAINACPHLRNHETPCSAACVPVGVNGHLLGVVHVTGPEHEPPDAEAVEQLVTLAGQVGVRVGAQRTLETTRLQASTDGLTGLANRRMLEARLGDLLRGNVSFALAVADVDRFKALNDGYGHELGDRALQLFAKVLEDNVRGHDLVARYGGEEFVLVYPELSVKKAMEVIERIRLALERAIDVAGLPPFTCSFGVTHSSAADNVDGIIRIADAGLLMAKELGRNRVVFADLDLAAEVFGGNADTAELPVATD